MAADVEVIYSNLVSYFAIKCDLSQITKRITPRSGSPLHISESANAKVSKLPHEWHRSCFLHTLKQNTCVCSDECLTRSVLTSIEAHKRESLMDVKPGDKLTSR